MQFYLYLKSITYELSLSPQLHVWERLIFGEIIVFFLSQKISPLDKGKEPSISHHKCMSEKILWVNFAFLLSSRKKLPKLISLLIFSFSCIHYLYNWFSFHSQQRTMVYNIPTKQSLRAK